MRQNVEFGVLMMEILMIKEVFGLCLYNLDPPLVIEPSPSLESLREPPHDISETNKVAFSPVYS